MSRMPLIALLLVLGLSPAQAADEDSIQVIELQHRSAEELLPVIRPLVEPQGSVSALQNRLIVRTSPARLAEIRQLVQQLDTRPRQLLITVSQGGSNDTRRRSAQVSGHIEAGEADIELPPEPDPGMPRVGVAGEHGAVEIQGGTRQSRSSSQGQQQLRVLEGREAVIYVGQSVPFVRRSVSPGAGGGITVEDIEYRDVTVGFSVLPRLQGDTVTLEISPQQESLARDGSGFVNVQRSSTQVSGRLGEWIDIGGVTQQQLDSSSGLLSSQKTRSREQRQVMVRVEAAD